MTINRDPRIAAAATRGEKASETKKALKRATEEKQGPGPHPTLDGIKRRKGQPEPATKH